MISLTVCFDIYIFTRDARCGGRVANFSFIFVKIHGKTFNRPTVDEITAAVTDEDAPAKRHLRVYTRANNGLQTVPVFSPHVDPMTYPLLFPYGEPGYSLNYRTICSIFKSDKFVELEMTFRNENCRSTMRQFYSSRSAIRKQFSLLHSSACLF